MISSHLRGGSPPRVVGVFSYRYDAHLVPALIENIAPLVDGWICYDDRGGDGVFSHEVRRRTMLLRAAHDAGARWALAIDPDERFERPLAESIAHMTASEETTAYTFAVRELYAELHYRVDGVWGKKRQARLLSLREGVVELPERLHLSWASSIPNARLSDTDFNLYHLKMMTPERRRMRAALYNFLDPDRRMQPIGYDYLADDADAVLEEILPGREYHPPHSDDGGLWMPRVPLS